MNDKFRVLIVSFSSFVVKRDIKLFKTGIVRIHHIAIWANDIEKLRDYYITHFGAKSNDIYINKMTGFRSYFLSFASGCQIEIMHRADISENKNDTIKQYQGYIHLALEVSSRDEVDNKAKELQEAGYPILRGPRITGDGYYEFETLDPENNRLEIIFK